MNGIKYFSQQVALNDIGYTKLIEQMFKHLRIYDGLVMPDRTNLYTVNVPYGLDYITLIVKTALQLLGENRNLPFKIAIILPSADSNTRYSARIKEILDLSKYTIGTGVDLDTSIDVVTKLDLTKKYSAILVDCNNGGKIYSNIDSNEVSHCCIMHFYNTHNTNNKIAKHISDLTKLFEQNGKTNITVAQSPESDIDLRTHISQYTVDDFVKPNKKLFELIDEQIFANNSLQFKKILCLVETDKFAKNAKTYYEKNRMDYYRCWNTRSYALSNSTGDCYDFLNLNNRFTEQIVLNTRKKSSHKFYPESGILFGTVEMFDEQIYDPVILKYIDVVMILNESGLTKKVETMINKIIHTHSCQYLKIIDLYRGPVGSQIKEYYDAFYKTSVIENLSKVEIYSSLIGLIDSKKITSSIKPNLKNLETSYGIKKKDYDYINRYRIVYVSTIDTNKNDKMTPGYMYELEKPYLYVSKSKTFAKADIKKIENRTKTLADEVGLINGTSKKKPKYTGPVWLGKGVEFEGSMVAFANESSDTIEFCQIIGTHKFSRVYKREGWTEKENKDKNILFLSPIFKKEKLSVFKRTNGISANKNFSMMERVVLN